MGKSEVVPMPIHRQESMYAACNKTDFGLFIRPVDEGDEERQFEIPAGMEMFIHQVAGHTSDGKSISLIKHQGTILKPITNEKTGNRELQFYEQLYQSTDEDLIEMKEFVPNYFGKVTIPINGDDVDCLVLEDLTRLYKDPCILDIKMGRRTWDPLAGYEKIAKEESKYMECKRDLSFCVPGFQVYTIRTNQLLKFDKNYGKKLTKDSVKDALHVFLNGDSGLCRCLIVQFLACLWKIQLWARKQRRVRLFSSSLLFLYDARRLRDSLKTDVKPKLSLQHSTCLHRPLSLMVLNQKIPTGFSGLQTKEGPDLKVPLSRNKFKSFDSVTSYRSSNVWQKSIRSLKRTHSFQNDYDKDVQDQKQDYLETLDQLSTDSKLDMWATVKMIDFAHAFPSEHHEIDKNYLEGIDSLVRIFEEFLVESE